ncbi:MAG: DUF4423 domain-containing protein [Myxococcales bacterium]|nr:DUF4423 domain-containing protein [Myxococcales bacterium]
MLDHDRLSRELMRALRGERSQTAFSRELGFESNVVYPWEAGLRHPEASTFLKAALRSGVDVGAALGAFTADASSWRRPRAATGEAAVQRLVAQLAGRRSSGALAARIGRNRNTVSRWRNGMSEPRLPDLLAFVEASTLRLLDFIALFADPAALETTATAYLQLQNQRRVAYELPWSHAVLRALELADYGRSEHHDDRFIASRLGIDEEEVRRSLDALEAAAVIEHRGSHYSIREVLAVDTRSDPARNLALKRHWATVSTERLCDGPPPEGALYSYNLFGISESALGRLRELHLRYFEEVRAIIDASETTEHVALMNLQLLTLDGAG